jgi:catechol 2,3-dioxygenase-like lactoylglutathione lyase family enzyme
VPVSPIRFVTLDVTDPDRSLDFYTRLLDLTPVPAPEADGREARLLSGRDGVPMLIEGTR